MTLPELFLLLMVAVTLALLPRLNDDRPMADDPRRATEELHIKPPSAETRP
jgi:hypothetical protein